MNHLARCSSVSYESCPFLTMLTGSPCREASTPSLLYVPNLSESFPPSPTPDPSNHRGLFQAGEVILSTRPARGREEAPPTWQDSRPASRPPPPAAALGPRLPPLPALRGARRSGPQTPVGGMDLGGPSGNTWDRQTSFQTTFQHLSGSMRTDPEWASE